MSQIAVECQVIEGTRLPDGTDPATIEDLGRYVLQEVGERADWVVTVVLTGNAHLRQLHRDFLGIDTDTDVMTFPAETEGTDPLGGDIVVSVDQAAIQAAEFGHTPAQEVTFLAVHGLLHLCGRNDAAEEERAAMLEEQRLLIEAFERRSLPPTDTLR